MASLGKGVARRSAWRRALLIGILVGAMGATAEAQDYKSYTRQTFDAWLQKYKDAKPDFKPGDVLTAKDLERMRPFVPPGYLELLNFPEFKAPIIARVSHRPRTDYENCTEKYGSQVRLKPDGSMENYVCGQPFPNASIDVNDPTSGLKAAWNFDARWENFGYYCTCPATWVRFGGSHSTPPPYTAPPAAWMEGIFFKWSPFTTEEMQQIYGGSGTFQRNLYAMYQRVYYTHLAQLKDHTMPVPGAGAFYWKEFTGFFEPFDIRGTVFIIYRYSDPFRADDAWAYIPQLRRVRRISAEVKSDSLLGTDHTLEDFYGFSGRPLEWNWRFLGWKDALVVMDSQYDNSHLYGPNGFIPNDVWSVRRFAVVERKSKDSRHPYSSAVDFWDADNWDTFYMMAWDRKGKLWKVWEFQKKWSETYKNWADINHGVFKTTFQSIQVVDLQNDRGTIWITSPAGYPNVDPFKIQALYDINKLESVHR
jgi:hypothetical protein